MRLLVLVSLLGACTPPEPPQPPCAACTAPETTAIRRWHGEVELGPDGRSDVLDLAVPEATRGVTIVVAGDARELYALCELTDDSGRELVGLPAGLDVRQHLVDRYYDERVPLVAGALHQIIRVALFSVTLPVTLPAGRLRLRVASTAARGTARVTVHLPPADGAATLHLSLVAISSGAAPPPPDAYVPSLQATLAQAGLTVAIDERRAVGMEPLGRPNQALAVLPEPGDAYVRLADLGRGLLATGALPIFLVDELPGAVTGLSLGLPGPPDPAAPYWGVAVERGADAELTGRIAAHEVGHFLGLLHVEDVGASGMVYPDPFTDTAPGQDNLMERGAGRLLSAEQAALLARSPLLRRD